MWPGKMTTPLCICEMLQETAALSVLVFPFWPPRPLPFDCSEPDGLSSSTGDLMCVGAHAAALGNGLYERAPDFDQCVLKIMIMTSQVFVVGARLVMILNSYFGIL